MGERSRRFSEAACKQTYFIGNIDTFPSYKDVAVIASIEKDKRLFHFRRGCLRVLLSRAFIMVLAGKDEEPQKANIMTRKASLCEFTDFLLFLRITFAIK